MMKIKNVAIAATLLFGLNLLGGCQMIQSGSSTHIGGQVAKQQKKTRRVSIQSTSPQPVLVGEDVDTLNGAVEKVGAKRSSRKSLAKTKSRKSIGKRNKRSKRSGKKSGRTYDRLIRHHARANGVPYALARAVVQVESGFVAGARGGVGEIGLMQLRKSTARGMGYRGSTRALYNPETNIKYGMRYLGKAYRLGGKSTCGAILKYNAGHGAKRMNPISRRYCGKVRRIIRGRV